MTRLRTRYTQRLPTAPGLRLGVPFFEGSGSKALDLSGKDNHGTIHNATWSRSEKGVCMDLDGDGDYIDCGAKDWLNITDAITLEAWIKQTSTPGIQMLYTRGLYQADGLLSYLNNGRVVLKTYQIGADQTAESTLGVITAGKWGHVAIVKDGSTAKIFVDSIDATSGTPSLIDPTSSTRTVTIGIYGNLSLYSFSGTIDEVRIYNRALSAEAQKRRYEQPWYDYVRGG